MKRLRWYDFITINLFWLGLNIRNTAVGSVFMPYLVYSFVSPEVQNTALGAMRAVGLLVAMLVQPAVGLMSDRSTSRFGSRRPFIFIGVMLDLVLLVAIGLSGSYWALFAAVLLIQISSNISHGALQGLIPDLVPEDQRGQASGVKAIFELIPIFLTTLIVARLVGAGELGWAIAVTCLGLLITMLLTMLLVKEKPLTEKPNTPLGPPMIRILGVLAGIGIGAAAGLLAGALVGGLAGLIAWPLAGTKVAQMIAIGVGGMVAMIVAVVTGVWAGALATLGDQARRQASFTWWMVNRLLFLAAVTSIQGFATYFLISAFGITSEEGIVLTANLIMAVGIFTLLTALPGGWLADRFGRKILVGLAGLVAAIGTVVLLTTTLVPNLTVMYVGGCIIGLAAGLFMSTNWALGTDLVPPEEAGRYLGISNLAGAGAGMIGAGIGGVVADWVNRYQPGMGYFAIFSCYAVLFFLSTLSLRMVRGRATAARLK